MHDIEILKFVKIYILILLIASSACNPISETGYSTANLNHPVISYSGATGTNSLVQSPMSISPTTLKTNGISSTCSIFPALPLGLSINGTTCVISGTPLSVLSSTTYTVTILNVLGLSSSTNLQLRVVSTTAELSCPANFVSVGKNTDLGVSNNFCVSKYEIKCSGSSCAENSPVIPGPNANAISNKNGKPWVRISQSNAQAACKLMGDDYDLISNPEWMTIAFEVEANANNWSSSSVGSGTLYRGHSDGINSSGLSGGFLAAAEDNDPYYLTGNNQGQSAGFGKEQRRTLHLANNEVIWDFSGNVWEWTNWDLHENLFSGPTNCSSGSREFPSVNCSGLLDMDYLPGNPANINAADYDSTFGLGTLIGGTGGGTVRGGISSGGTDAGIFSLDFEFSASLSSPIIGFRCVYRP